jgi:tetratricopeptide (TPR) repeat protein
VLVTSRRSTFSAHLGARTFPLKVLPRAESLALLRAHVHGQPFGADEEEALDAICAELGDLPLAVHLAGSFLARYRNVVTPAAYLAQLRDQTLLGHKSLQGYGAQNSPTGHDLHVGRTFALSWDRLDPTDPVDVIGRSLLQHAAFLAPGEPIPHVLLVAPIELPQDEADAMLIVQDALHRLLSLGLLDALESDVYTIHRLVTAFVQQVGGDSERARIAIEQILLTTAQHVNHSGNPARLLPLQSHLRAITDAARKREDVFAARLCNELSYHLQEVGDYRNARRYCEQALIIFEKRLGQEHLFTARCLNDLAEILRNEGAYDEARPLYERALTICEKQGGPDHPLTTTTSNNLALLLFAQQNYAEARPLLEHALVRSEKQLGSDDPDIVTNLNNLAELLRAQEDYAGARPLFERALAICEEHFEPDHPDTARALNNLANLLLDQKDYAEARLLYERALGIWERQRVPDHPNMARSLNNLATLLHTQGAYTEARPLYERALVICEFRLGPDHPFSQLVRDNLQSLPES